MRPRPPLARVFNDVPRFLSLVYVKRHKSRGSPPPTHRGALDEAAKDGRSGHRSSGVGRGLEEVMFHSSFSRFLRALNLEQKKQILGTNRAQYYASISLRTGKHREYSTFIMSEDYATYFYLRGFGWAHRNDNLINLRSSIGDGIGVLGGRGGGRREFLGRRPGQ